MLISACLPPEADSEFASMCSGQHDSRQTVSVKDCVFVDDEKCGNNTCQMLCFVSTVIRRIIEGHLCVICRARVHNMYHAVHCVRADSFEKRGSALLCHAQSFCDQHNSNYGVLDQGEKQHGTKQKSTWIMYSSLLPRVE